KTGEAIKDADDTDTVSVKKGEVPQCDIHGFAEEGLPGHGSGEAATRQHWSRLPLGVSGGETSSRLPGKDHVRAALGPSGRRQCPNRHDSNPP
ncbi:hypothetical protein, partial [Amycolatopsis sp. NPDC051128]|uniref:hypothetical protein n=1 Tax=Amycolatopsis sp. NPDC051128 TaxID=3155412 RepID=UPI00342ECD9D